MEARIPEPGQTNWLTTDAENTRIAFTDWVSTVDSHFVKKEGKKLAELTHPETLERARDVVKVLGLNKAGHWVAILRNDTASPITVTHRYRSYLICLDKSSGRVSCYESDLAVPPGVSMAIYSPS